MKIEYIYAGDIVTLEKFADTHGLTLRVVENRGLRGGYSFNAMFTDCKEVSSKSSLWDVFGEGATEEEAINDYILKIQSKTLAHNVPGKPQKLIKVPCIKPYYSKDL